MNPYEVLRTALKNFAGIDEAGFSLSEKYWQERHYKKGEFYNE